MIATPADIEALWTRLSLAGRGSRQFVTLRIDSSGSLDVHAALRMLDGAPCLLFELSADDPVRSLEFEAGGMRCSRTMLEVGPALTLSLEDEAKRDLFASLCADVIAYAASETAEHSIRAVVARLEAWQAFLRSTTGSLSRSETVGLMGELHILKSILEKDAALLETWRAPDDGLHDFEHLGMALEVKTTLGAGSRIAIANLDQLDDVGLERLALVHLRLHQTPDGQCLEELTAAISSILRYPEAKRQFSSALLRRGLSPEDWRALSSIRAAISQTHVHFVDDGFPRLVRRSVSPSITEASYVLELSHFASTSEPLAVVLDDFTTRHQ
ncbi:MULTISPECIES: PD-(D/E)XK motif protein [Rhizobium/Agrobacterium group]|uniref:PD-(D/E)XK motif protein n=2 Tax=Rhizobium/Agrobacterium group TaxID=227290 RepID=B9JXK2_ALLAM|nr:MULTISPECIES: PD-(D/E)XK motif protein [Rhizobium/Agrobacterium group]ACM36979.1 conserved hypothetical protein [Allorhizobium ampelinum S4]MUO42175.1 PD-(D/E)XK motif protein [Agrobacterium vitis]MUP10910.1 PD-(D/E)XK motif protein [Agrobacterium vitis]